MKHALIALFPLCPVCLAQQRDDSTLQVDVFIGTQTISQHDHGNTLPGATRPFGMLYWSPDPIEGEFYRYEASTVRGFSLTHLSGPGCGIFGDIPIFPMLGIPQYSPSVHGSALCPGGRASVSRHVLARG